MNHPRDLITEYGLTPNKALGQNFLVDDSATELIVRTAAEPGLALLEIGPGLGALTFPLAETGLPLAAVELDKALAQILRGRLPERVHILNADFLKVRDAELAALPGFSEGVSVAANLPYYVTSPICMRLVLSELPVRRMTLMMQKEAAERFLAGPHDKNYVPLTVLAQWLFDVTPILELSPASYWPQPDVSSAVLRFDRSENELPAAMPRLVKAAFAMRRKTLVNNLCALGLTKSVAAELLGAAGISPGARAEELSPEDFARLAAFMG